ncbi:MAG: undecaprenyl diphosphate synthase family protein, partial [Clostridia bacterium]|nr:undecaprenyl diphosphate synthase family protein [Clostridia bacterium]
ESGEKQISAADFSKFLYTGGLPDPDLIVRASGEQRLSNFMLYQAAYSEFYFPKVHWPDFDEQVVDASIAEFQSRHRRFGKV